MLTEKDYCDYDTCVALKELGFKEKTLAYYTSERFFHWRRAYIYDVAIPDLAKSSNIERYKHIVDAVSLWDAKKWLREERGMLLQPTYLELSDEWICVIRDKNKRHGYSAQKQKDYEDALLEGIKEAVKILKENETIHR